jgi:carbonic anhydrase
MILTKIVDIPVKNSTVELPGDAMAWMDSFLPFFGYFSYEGSLTTEPCDEVVNWIVMKNKIGISAAQV